MASANGSVPPRPNYPPGNGPTPAAQVRAAARASAQQPYAPPQRNRNTKVEINKLSLLPADGILPPVSLSFNKTVVNGDGARSGGARRSLPGSGFTSDEDIRAFSEALRKEARPRAVERALDAETLEAVLRTIPDVHGSMSGSRARARRVARVLKKIAAAEKLIGKEAARLWAVFTREFEAELAQISSGRRRGEPRHRHDRHGGTVWKQW